MVTVKNKIILVLSLLEMLLFSGVFYGFNSLIPIYKKAGVFSQYCEVSNSTTLSNVSCPTQDTHFARAFLIWMLVQAVMSLLLGVILDRFGVKVVKVISASCILAAFLCFGFTANVNWLLYIAGSVMTAAAHGLGICNMQLSLLVSKYQVMFIALISSLYDASAFVMTAIKLTTDVGVPFAVTCTSYGIFGFCVVFGGMFLLKSRVADLLSENKEEEKEEKRSETEQYENNMNENTEGNKTSSIEELKASYDIYMEEIFPSLFKCILSPQFIIHFVFFVAIMFRFTFFMTQMTLQLEYLFQDRPKIVEHFQSVSNFFFLGSIFISPLFGFLIDKIQQKTFLDLTDVKDVTPKMVYNKVTATFALPILVCTCSMLLASILMFVANQYAFYGLLVCVVVTRSILFGINGAYLLSAFPQKFFGTIIGMVFVLAAAVNLLQQVMVSYASKNSNPNIVNAVLIGLCSLGFVHVLYLKLRR